MKRTKALVTLFLTLLFLSACGPKEAAVTPTPTPTATPTQTPTPTPTPNTYEQERQMGMVEELYHRPFEELPQDLRDSLEWDGEERTEEGYNFLLRTYTAPGITVVTTQAPEEVLENWLECQLSLPQEEREIQGDDDTVRAEIEGEKGREWLYSFTLEDDRYATVLGLKVGSTMEEASVLGYQLVNGENTFGVPMETYLHVTVEDGVVTRLHGSFALGRYVGRYWDI